MLLSSFLWCLTFVPFSSLCNSFQSTEKHNIAGWAYRRDPARERICCLDATEYTAAQVDDAAKRCSTEGRDCICTKGEDASPTVCYGDSNEIATPPVALRILKGIMTDLGKMTETNLKISGPADAANAMYPKPVALLLDLYGNQVVGKYAQDVEVHIDVKSAPGTLCELGGQVMKRIATLQFSAEFDKVFPKGTPFSGPHELVFEGAFYPLGRGHELVRKLTPMDGHHEVSVHILECAGEFYNPPGGDDCVACPTDSTRINTSGSVGQACQCKQDHYAELMIQRDACSCMKEWVFTGFDNKIYDGW